ncbi:helix-turn-helix transcriptional regulator [Pararobbsia alpina]|uniref:HTH-type transcriptional activator RhaR n=1 Tax=Pararobbsia alpina TaxID=621374 RepID=A0A6S7B7B0_9BURK|nr:AraC family transcriptional regulator [Pararobbsia alpina]CAB3790230.1 HTH-type transcriptional activator RhaR [Pararobbsia alpina]
MHPNHRPLLSLEPNAATTLRQPNLAASFQLTGAHSREVPAGWAYPRHDHPYFELCLLEAGRQDTRLTGRTLRQAPDDLLLLCPFDAHASTTPVASALYCIHFDVDELALRRLLCRGGSRLFEADSTVGQHLRPVLQQMRSIAHHDGLVSRLQLASALFALFAVMAGAYQREYTALPELPQATLQTATRLAERIEREVDAGGTTSIESMIRQLGYHPDYGNALFRQVFGLSVRQYESTLRLRRAKMLLLDDVLSVGEIATRLGYADSNGFSRQFKRWSGVSPLAFRVRAEEAPAHDADARAVPLNVHPV